MIGAGGLDIVDFGRWTWGFLDRSACVLVPFIVALPFATGLRPSVPLVVMLLATSAIAILMVFFHFFGLQACQVTQFQWRIESCFWLSPVIVSALFLRHMPAPIRRRCRGMMRKIVLLALVPVIVLSLGAVRNDHYIRTAAAKSVALPEPWNQLGRVVRCMEGAYPLESVATLSRELNNLFALWTGADLLLPEGFPLLMRGSNERIVQGVVRLLSFYNVAPDVWNAFPINEQADSVQSWKRSRILSERQSFLYGLFHHAAAREHDEWVAQIG